MADKFDKVARIARDAVNKTFGRRVPIGTFIHDAYTFENEAAIRIAILFANDVHKHLTGRQIVSIRTYLREKLREIGETRQPMISFVSKDDEEELRSARSGAAA